MTDNHGATGTAVAPVTVNPNQPPTAKRKGHEVFVVPSLAGKRHVFTWRTTQPSTRALFSVVFSDPQIAIVGGGWATLRDTPHVTGEVSFTDQGRARVMLRNQGLLHVYAARDSGAFLGAEMVMPDTAFRRSSAGRISRTTCATSGSSP